FGHRLTHSITSSLDLHCINQKPAISSFVSANGPSTTVRLLPENLTRAPRELGWSPSPASITPALTSSSLKRVIWVSISSLGITPASLSAFALTMTRKRIVWFPFRFTSNGGHPNRQTGDPAYSRLARYAPRRSS